MNDNTTEQEHAIREDARFVAILASAGSGKTRTLVHRIANEIKNGITPSNIVAFTFTNRAADQLKAKVYKKISGEIDDEEFSKMYVGTIHSFCNQYLRGLYEYYNYDVLDDIQAESLVYRLYDELKLDAVYGYSFLGSINRFLKDYEIFENELLSFGEIPGNIRPPIQKFCEILIRNRLLTFGSMIRVATAHIKKNRGIENRKHLFVDEYQDINPAQEKLIRAMAKNGSKLTVVGDDLQCIYQWRGSDVEKIIHFKKNWGSETHVLSTNFRSRKDIVTIADDFSETVEPRFKEKNKKMVSFKKYRADEKNIHWVHLDSEDEQNKLLVKLIKRAKKNGYSYNDIAILLRSVKNSGESIIRELNKNGIQNYCPQLSVTEGTLIKDTFVPLFRLLSLSKPKNQEEEDEQEELFKAFFTGYTLLQPDEKLQSSGFKVIEQWTKSIQTKKSNSYNVRAWLYRFFEESEINWDENDIDKLTQMGILTRIIRSVEETNRRNIRGIKRKKPAHVYKHLAFMLESQTENSKSLLESVKDVNAVFVSTVHQAKGLEWQIVILPSVSHRLFPVKNRGHGSSFPDSVAKRYGTTEMDERRLFYVAITRPKSHLVLLSYPTRREYSPFIMETKGPVLIDKTINYNKIEFEKEHNEEESEEQIISMGVSDLLMLYECPFQYNLRRIYGIYPQVGDELGYGRSLHEIIQQSAAGGKWKNNKEIAKEVEDHVHIPLEGDKQLDEHKKAIERQVKGLALFPELAKLEQSEMQLRFFIGNSEITGVVDSYTKNEKNEIELIDWKTSIHEGFLERYYHQIQLYVYALQQRGETVKGAKLIDVKHTVEKGRIVEEKVNIEKKEINKFIDELQESVEVLRNLKFNPKPSKKACSICDIRQICKYRFKEEET